MKKYCLSFFIIALICLNVPIVSAFAQQESEALLSGKILNISEVGGGEVKNTTTLLTDNNTSTYINLPRATHSSGVDDIVWANLDKKYIITGYKLTAVSGGIINLVLSDANGYSTITMNNVSGDLVNIDYPNTVSGFNIHLDGLSKIDSVKVYELELYGYEVSTNPSPNPTPTGDRAILVITMLNGLEKEYDLSMDEVNDFINWYDTKDAGSGPSKYAINEHDNNKGPFSKRTDYVIFNNILTFEVNEYSTVTTATY